MDPGEVAAARCGDDFFECVTKPESGYCFLAVLLRRSSCSGSYDSLAVLGMAAETKMEEESLRTFEM